MRSTTRLILAVALSLPLLPVYASAPDYASFLPDTDRVNRDYPAPNARAQSYRTGAYFVLCEAIQQLAGQMDPRNMPPAVAAKFQAYEQEIAKAKLTPQQAVLFRAYGLDANIRRQVLPAYFPPAVLDQLGAGLMSGRRSPPIGSGTTQPRPNPYGGTLNTNPYGRVNTQPQMGLVATLAVFMAKLLGSIFTLVVFILFPLGLIGLWIYHKIIYSRRYWVPRSNRQAIQLFGSDPKAREQKILEAFETADFPFQFVGTNYNKPYRMRFVLIRQGRSVRRGDHESMRLAYLAYNRGNIDEETFHAYRFTAIYGDGMTDPSQCDYVGWYNKLKATLRQTFKGTHGQFSLGRGVVADFARPNALPNMESAALAMVLKLTTDNPSDQLYADIKRRFYEGVYWLSRNDLQNSVFAPTRTPYGVSFGVMEGTNQELVFAREGAIVTIAPPRSGKTQCCVFPNLLRWPGPAVVLDVKGEIYDGTARWRSERIGPVIKFSPLDPAHSACYNPLVQVRRDSLYVWEDSRFLADMMIVPSGAQDPFWENRSRDLLTLIIADLAFWNRAEERPMSKVMSLINRVGWKEFVERCQENPEISDIREEGTSLANMEAKTLDGILQTAKSSLSAWSGERIKLATKKSDWTPIDLRNGKNLTIYLCLKPNEMPSYISLMRVFIAQHIRGLTTDLPSRDAAPILFVLDEFPQLKNMPPITDALEVGSQYGIRLWMFAQYLSQIKSAYGEKAEGMVGACAVRTFMNPSAQDGTAKALSEQIGLKEGEQHGGKGYGVTEANKYIVSPTQLSGPEFKETHIVLGVGSKPAKVRKMYAYNDPELSARMRKPVAVG